MNAHFIPSLCCSIPSPFLVFLGVLQKLTCSKKTIFDIKRPRFDIHHQLQLTRKEKVSAQR
ncbi:hypothetical protein BDZ45DRAFT_456802 [Acephala macrosclerotiorum]|nr:hypothetical protein BDZ45DRAFT_456802 [Acephala macrosclerotiorum]